MSHHPGRALGRVLLLAGALLAACGPASADVRETADRMFTLAEPGFRGNLDDLQVTAAPDGTAFVLDGADGRAQRLWRFGADATRPQRSAVGTGDAWVSAISATTSGGVLLARPLLDRIDLRTPEGRVQTVAGAPPDARSDEPQPDGVPATATTLCRVGRPAALPDGGFLLTDNDGEELRRVGPDGRIATLLTLSPEAASGRCVPAAGDPERIRDVAPAPDGSLVLLLGRGEARRVVRRTEDGALATIRSGVDWVRLAVAHDGAILGTSEYGGLTRIPPGGGTPRPVFLDDTDLDTANDFDGRRARDFPATGLGAVAPSADGGLLALEGLDSPRLRYLAPAAPERTAVALELRAGRVGAGSYRAAYRLTRPATLRLAVYDSDGRRLGITTRPVPAGAGTLVVRGRFPFAMSRVRLTATTSDGVRAVDQLRLRLAAIVPLRDARRLLVPSRVDIGGGCSNCDVVLVPVRAEGCRRLDARRVACRYSHRIAPSRRACIIAAVRRTRDGTLEQRSFDCPRRGPRIPATGDGTPWEDVRADVT